MTTRWDDLRAKAQAATPGPWGVAAGPNIHSDGVDAVGVAEAADGYIVADVYSDIPSLPMQANAAHIAAANPATILALLAERDALREALEKMVDAAITLYTAETEHEWDAAGAKMQRAHNAARAALAAAGDDTP